MEVKGNFIVQGSYIDIHDNEVVNLSVDKAEVKVNGKTISNPTPISSNPSELNSQEALIISSIVTLMEELGSDGEPIFKFQNQWMAIFRVIVDKNLGASKDDYKGFCDWINRLKPDGFRVKLSYVSLKKINDTIYSKPYRNWVYDCSYNASRKPYDNMVNIVERFTEILENNGIK